MRLKLIKEEGNELKFEIDEGHTFCSLLQGFLCEDESVELAGYDIPHPLIPSAIFYVRTRKPRKPREAIERALKRIQSTMDELADGFDRAMREWVESKGAGGGIEG
ncbi:MAG: DNA-directed RNA polymerase subunit L [Candidatus Bathyarchaeia archaeon]